MVRKLVIAAAVSVAVLGSAARADPLLASNPQTFMDFFVAEGVSAQLTVDVAGDPLIEFLHEGEKKLLFFYDCVENRDCLAVQFFAGFKLDGPVSLEKLNDWNSGERRFTRAYRMEDDVARIEMDIATILDGISARDFRDLFNLWLDRQAEFGAFISG
ncbi:YbjN domain-containing protein [Maritimibacter sp. HL-12]|jgi:hypothetical protein|uniref:YbjN domain-containing protein n=1 Tax=Maritimibacter sp. HL-12 TaxID=1162418 RepID=UPI000A0F33B7|nr:YbjN domain-containing protein [Maritimibacter sp. HL-12]SMH41394.1 Putative sensory transduction regulator [Maritimibacter sp. HL-12]